MTCRWPKVAGPAALTAVLWLAGGRVLPAPPLLRPDRLVAWWRSLGPAPAVFATVRAGLLLIGTVWTSATIVVLGATAVVAGGRWGARGAEVLLQLAATGGRLLGLKGVLRVSMGLAVPGAALAACTGPSAATTTAATSGRHADGASETPPAPVLIGPPASAGQAWVAPTGASGPLATTSTPAPSPTTSTPAPSPTTSTPAVPVPTPDARQAPAAPPTPARTPEPATLAPPPPTGSPPGPRRAVPGRPTAGNDRAAEWTVRPGDDFWSIAEVTVGAASDPVDRSASIGRYWVRLIEANRSRLPDPSDPSLLFPGDVLVLPPP
ncbi:MAG: LysM peptidoglycan-binding domain-containing protein [Actinomycetota bacterium]|nr:LysM peptidoglycan-binding domain-containing protein [Actinomycetota bacterium]